MPNRRNLLFGAGAAGLGTMLGFAGVLRAFSLGQPKGLVTDAGQPIVDSISERVFVGINGLRQACRAVCLTPVCACAMMRCTGWAWARPATCGP